MEIEYELMVEDYKAWAEYYASHHPEFKKQINRTRRKYIVFTAVFALIAVYSGLGDVDWLFPAIFFGVLAGSMLSFYFLLPRLTRKRYVKTVLKQAQQSLEDGVGKRQLSVTSEGLVAKMPSALFKFKWDTVQGIASTEQELFFLMRHYPAIIVPKRHFSNASTIEEFTELARRYLTESKEIPSA